MQYTVIGIAHKDMLSPPTIPLSHKQGCDSCFLFRIKPQLLSRLARMSGLSFYE